jgi:hypothetical protein
MERERPLRKLRTLRFGMYRFVRVDMFKSERGMKRGETFFLGFTWRKPKRLEGPREQEAPF